MNSSLIQFISSFHNAQERNKENFSMTKSKFLTEILDLLTISGYIVGYSHKKDLTFVYFKYPLIKKYKIKLISKSSKRMYMGVDTLSKKFNKNEFVLISSPYGLITLKESFLLKCGGEVVLKIDE